MPIDVMGQPSKSIPDEPIRNAADYVAWLTATLDALHLDRVSLVGMSFGGWLALNLRRRRTASGFRSLCCCLPAEAAADGQTVQPARDADGVASDTLHGELVHALAGIHGSPGETDARPVLELMYLGLKHFRVPRRDVACHARDVL